MTRAYYNEIEPFAADWLRNLIAAGHIAPGDVDERDIRDVRPSDLRGYTQCHFFAGIGLWSLALRWAGVGDGERVWTGSCPCQPFSAAGARAGTADERHLWPHWFHLIGECAPPVVYGEQVASKDGLGWLDLVSSDLEGAGYAVGANDLCAAGIDAPHIRQRLWFVGERLGESDRAGSQSGRQGPEAARHGDSIVTGGGTERVEHTARDGREQRRAEPSERGALSGRGESGLADASAAGFQERECDGRVQREKVGPRQGEAGERRRDSGRVGNAASQSGERHARAFFGTEKGNRPSADHRYWRDADWLFCRDGKWRPVEPGTFPLADGYPQRVGRLRAYGNAIVPQVAAAFVESHLFARSVGFSETSEQEKTDNG